MFIYTIGVLSLALFCTQLVPLCSTVNLDEADVSSGPSAMRVKEIQTGSDVLSAWVPENVLWRERKELLVKFLNVIPREWHYHGSGMNVGNIMSWANEWNLRGGETIPKFTLVQDDDACPSDIRVLFTSKTNRYFAVIVSSLKKYRRWKETDSAWKESTERKAQ